MRLGKSICMRRDTKDKQWKLNPLVKQSSEPLLPRQSEARVLLLPLCCRKGWGGKSDKLQSHGMGYCTDRTLNSLPAWAELRVLYPGMAWGQPCSSDLDRPSLEPHWNNQPDPWGSALR